MANYATTLAQGFSQKVISLFFEQSIAMDISNQDYEGEVKDKLSKLNILTFGAIPLQPYTGTALSPSDPTESVGVLTTDMQRAYYFKIQSLQRFHSWIKNPDGTLLATLAKTLAQELDAYVLGFGADVARGQASGTDFTTGTVTIDIAGVVTHSGTSFTAAMAGKGFKAAGHTKWYRVKHYTSTSQIEIENDEDDVASHYDGGVIGAGAAYTIQALTRLQVSKSTLYGFILALKEKLDLAQVPATDRYLVVPPAMMTILLQVPELIPAVETAYAMVLKGFMGEVAGFKVFMNTQVAGNNTDGFQVLAIHKSWLTFAMGWTESGVEDLIGDFGKAYKGLNIWGAKVVDERRKAAAMGLWYI